MGIYINPNPINSRSTATSNLVTVDRLNELDKSLNDTIDSKLEKMKQYVDDKLQGEVIELEAEIELLKKQLLIEKLKNINKENKNE